MACLKFSWLTAIGILLMEQINLKAMSRKELRSYILKNRHDDEKVNAAIAESTSRSDWTHVSADTPLEEQERILREAIERKND